MFGGDVSRAWARLYVETREFTATYDKVRPGLADFMRDAMAYYAEHTLAKA